MKYIYACQKALLNARGGDLGVTNLQKAACEYQYRGGSQGDPGEII